MAITQISIAHLLMGTSGNTLCIRGRDILSCAGFPAPVSPTAEMLALQGNTFALAMKEVHRSQMRMQWRKVSPDDGCCH